MFREAFESTTATEGISGGVGTVPSEAESGDEGEAATPETSEDAPRAETVRWSLPVTGLAGELCKRWILEGERCLVKVLLRETSFVRSADDV